MPNLFVEKYDMTKAITPPTFMQIVTFHGNDVMCKEKHTFKTKVSKYLIIYIFDSIAEKVGKPYMLCQAESNDATFKVIQAQY